MFFLSMCIGGSDFTPINEVLTFSVTQISPRVVPLTLLDDNFSEPTEQLTMNLQVGSIVVSNATVTLSDNDLGKETSII